jgi:hypothetical protein
MSVMISLGGCALSGPGTFVSTYCSIDKPISWSKKDTDKSIAEIKEHNAVHDSVCG